MPNFDFDREKLDEDISELLGLSPVPRGVWHKLRNDAHRSVELERLVLVRLAELEGREVRPRGDLPWHIIKRILTTLPATTQRPDYLVVAKHLLALGTYNDPQIVLLETGQDVEAIRGLAHLKKPKHGHADTDTLSFRKAYAALASGIGTDRTNLSPSRPHAVSTTYALRDRLLEFIQSDDFVGLWQQFESDFEKPSPVPKVSAAGDALDNSGASDPILAEADGATAAPDESARTAELGGGVVSSQPHETRSQATGLLLKKWWETRATMQPRTRTRTRIRRGWIFGIVSALAVVAISTPLALQSFQPQEDPRVNSGRLSPVAEPPVDVADRQIASASWGPPRDAVSAQSRNSIVTLNSMIDNPVHGDERNFAQVRPGKEDNSAYADEIPITAGEEYVGYVYFNNDAAPDATGAVAENTRLRLQIPAVVYGSANVHALLSSDNAAPTEVWDGFTLVLPEPAQSAALSYVPDSATLHVGGKADGRALTADALLGPEGALLGCDLLDGKLTSSDGCSGYVTFRFAVDQPNFTVDAAARVKGSTGPFANHVDMSPGDVVEVRVAYTNAGTTQQDNVSLQVLGLPENMRYVAESTKIANSKTKGVYRATVDGVVRTGYKLGRFVPGGNVYLKFDAIVDATDSSSAAGSRWIGASRFARVTTSGGYKDASLTFTVFGNAQPTTGQDTAGSSGFWKAHWGPQRELFTIDSGGATYPTFNSITDNSVFGDERDFVNLRYQSTTKVPNVWENDVWAKVGQTYDMRVYVNNAGTDTNGVVSAGWLQRAKLQVGISHGDNEASVYGVLSAINAPTVWDGATLHFDEGVDVVFDTEYALMENNAHPGGGSALDPRHSLSTGLRWVTKRWTA